MVDAPAADDFPLGTADNLPVTPSIAEQQRQHAEDLQPTGDDLPLGPAEPPSILGNGWLVAGRRLLDAGERGVGLGARATLQGLGSAVGGVGDLLTAPGRMIGRAIGYQPPDGQDFYTTPSEQIEQGIDSLGLPAPATPGEQSTATAVRGAAAAVPALASPGGAATVMAAARPLLQGAAGAVTGEAAASSDLVPSWAKPTANLIGSMFGAKLADAGANIAAKTVNAIGDATSPTYQAFQRAGVDPDLLGTVAGGTAGPSAEAAFSRIPFASSVIRPAQQRAVDQFGNSVERTASQLDPQGVAYTAQSTGEAVQQAARDWRSNVFPAQQTAAWAPLNQRLAGTAVDATPYRTALEYAASPPNLASMPETQRAFASATARRWLDALNTDAPPGTPLSWEQAQAIKQRIGDAMGTPDIVASIGDQQLRAIYGGLAEGMRQTAANNGQGRLFQQANALTTQGHAFIENTLSKVIRTPNPLQESIAPEQATNNLLNSGDTALQDVRDRIPQAADALAAFHLRQAAVAKPSVAGDYNDTSTGTFLTNLNRMRQTKPGGYQALYSTPAVQQQVDDLSTVAQQLRETQRHLNTSGTAEQLGWMQYIKGIGEAAAEGKPVPLAMAVGAPPLFGLGAGRLLTSPGVTRFAAAQGLMAPAVPPRVVGAAGALPGLLSGNYRP